MCVSLSNDSEEFNNIVQNIKQEYLSNTHFPKLVLGTGLSISYRIPGMDKLYDELSNKFEKCDNNSVYEMWQKKKGLIQQVGLEKGLSSITVHEQELVNYIKKYTAQFILNEEIRLFDDIFQSKTGFTKLLLYLKETCSVNHKILDIMTPNYDRIIEIVCDGLKINVITGFTGQNVCYFNQDIMKRPKNFYNIKNTFFVRLFKPHGSLNWLNINGEIILTNDNNKLIEKPELIEIITPGESKYKAGLTIQNIRCMREDFNEVLENQKNYSLFIFGYGFNDEHFDIIFNNLFTTKKTLIVSKSIKKEILDRAMENSNIVAFYKEGSINYLIYKKKKYKIDINMWDINDFSNVFIG